MKIQKKILLLLQIIQKKKNEKLGLYREEKENKFKIINELGINNSKCIIYI